MRNSSNFPRNISISTRRKILLWLPAIIWMTLIFLMSHQPGGDSSTLSKLVLDFFGKIGLDLRGWFGDDAMLIVRKMAHFTEYFILALLIMLGKGKLAPIYVSVILAIIYASTDEFHQLFIPGRIGTYKDVLVDGAGAIAAGLFVLTVRKISAKKAKK